MEGKIVVPLDGTPLAEAILPHAVLLAHSTGNSLVLLRAVSCPTTPDPLTGMYVSLEDICSGRLAQARAYLRGVARNLQNEPLNVQTVSLQGQAAQQILAYVERDHDVTMIAMATHGRDGAARWLSGSVAEQVLQATPVPLLLVRAETSDAQQQAPPARPCRVIMVPLDGSPLAEQALDTAQTLAAATRARLELVGVVPGRGAEGGAFNLRSAAELHAIKLGAYLTNVAARVQNAALPVSTHLVHGSPAGGINDDSELAQADLIVMATHGRRALQRLWTGSVALQVLRGATCPLLLVRGQMANSAAPDVTAAS